MVSKLKLFAETVYKCMEEFGAARAARQLARYKHLGI